MTEYSNKKKISEKKQAKIEKQIAKMESLREKREAGVIRKIPIVGSVIRAVTFEFPKSGFDAMAIDIVQGVISLVPIIGDVVIGIPRTARYSIDKEIPSEVRGKVVAISTGDFAVGIVPVVGDIIDFAFFSNTLSYKVVQDARGEKFNMFRRRPVKDKSEKMDKIDKIEKITGVVVENEFPEIIV